MPRSLPPLRAWTPLAALVAPLLAAAIVGTAGARRIEAAADAQLASSASIVAYHVESLLTARLRALESIAAFESPMGEGAPLAEFRRAMIASLALRYPEFVWVGFTDSAGRVDAARDGLLAGTDVSERDWWRAARAGPHVGEVHAGQLLAPLLPPDRDGRPRRFLDLAVPLRRANGEVYGVLGAHIDAGWMIAVRDELTRMLDASQGALVRLRQQDGMTMAREPLVVAEQDAGGRMTGTLGGRPMEMAVQPLGGDVVVARLRWQAVVMRDPAEHRAPARSFLLLALGVGGAIGAAAAGAVAWLGRRARRAAAVPDGPVPLR